MADAGQELESAIWLIKDAARRLEEKHPEHDLLRYVDSIDFLQLPDDFIAEFGGEKIGKKHRGTEFARAAMYANYHKALEAAIA